MPVVCENMQSTLPHAQSAELAAEPSVIAQTGNWPHLLWVSSQYSPPTQSTLPHAQSTELTSEPSVLVHACGREHVLDAAVHTMPVPCPSLLLVHAVFPHLHHPTLYVTLPALSVVPSSWGQTGPV